MYIFVLAICVIVYNKDDVHLDILTDIRVYYTLESTAYKVKYLKPRFFFGIDTFHLTYTQRLPRRYNFTKAFHNVINLQLTCTDHIV